jgi:uncharacterized protein
MRELFVDTGYWIALLYPKDSLHQKAQALHRSITAQAHHLITSEIVLIEFVNFFSKSSTNTRQSVVTFVNQIQTNSNVLVVPQSAELFDRALTFYA